MQAGLPSGWPDAAIIHYLLGVAQTILFEQSIGGEHRATWVSVLRSVPVVRDISSNFKVSQPQGRTGTPAPLQLPAPPTSRARPGTCAQARGVPALLSAWTALGAGPRLCEQGREGLRAGR